MMDDARVIAAVIAVIGVLVSVSSSIAVSYFSGKREVKKLRLELYSKYSENILAQRIKYYPEIYAIMSDLAKEIRFRNASQDLGLLARVLSEGQAKIDSWDSSHAIFLGSRAQNTLFNFRRRLSALVEEIKVNEGLSMEEEIDLFVSQIESVELDLKADLGIFLIDSHDKKEFIESYRELTDEVLKTRGVSQV